MSQETDQRSNLEKARALIPDENAAIYRFRDMRWQHGPFCPYCGYDTLYPIKWRDVWKCADCRKNFSITVGTIFQGTKIPFRNWLLAIAYVIDHPENVSGTALAKELGISQKRAWLMIERLRQATLTRSFKRPEAGKHARPRPRKRSERDQAGDEGGSELSSQPNDIPPWVKSDNTYHDQMLASLSRVLFGGKGFSGIGDEFRAKQYLEKRSEDGCGVTPKGSYHWARRQGWKHRQAAELRRLVHQLDKIEKARTAARARLEHKIKTGLPRWWASKKRSKLDA